MASFHYVVFFLQLMIFSGPYLMVEIVMVVVCPSSVTGRPWLISRFMGKFYTSNYRCVLNLSVLNFSDLVQGEHFQNWG